MKKILIASIVALTVALVASDANAALTRNLSVGSTGADVSELQSFLISKGYSIPAISSGVAQSGYFGTQTKTALMAYQAANGIPNTGFFGPLTMASVNSMMGGTTGSATCPAGYTCSSNTVAVNCPVGFTCTPIGGGAPVTGSPITTIGVPGTLDFTIRSTPSNGTDVKKGEDKVIASYDLEADDSDMEVSNISLNFNRRLWLYADSITLMEGSKVIASKTGLSSSDFTEVTSGSDYRIRFSGMNYVVPANSKSVLTVKVKMLSFTDRSADTITLTNAEVRVVDGTGVTTTETATDDRTFDFVASNVGNVVATVNSASPLDRIVQTSTTGTTDDVVLMVVDLKAENRDLNVDELRFTLNASSPLATFGTLFDDIMLTVDGTDYSADSIGSTTVFTDLDIDISKDQKKAVTLKAKVADADDFTDGIMASTTLTANTTNIVGEDTGYDTVTVTSATITSSNATFLQSGARIVSSSATATGVADTPDLASVQFQFTIQAGDRNAIYLSATPSTLVATSTTASSSALTLVATSPNSISGDSTGVHYIVPAGSSRQFILNGTMNNANGTTGSKEFKITRVYFDDDTTGLQEFSINFGLESLRATATLTD